MKKIILVLAVLVLITGVIVTIPREAKVTDYAMDTVISIWAKSPLTGGSPEAPIQEAIAEVRRIDALMSTTNPQSDIYKINNAPAGEFTRVSPEVYELIEFGISISDLSRGSFDISINPVSLLWDFTSESPSVPEDSEIEALLPLVNYKNIILRSEDTSVCLAKDGMSISLGAMAKGYAADKAAQILRDAGIKDGIIDLGGNIYALGDKNIGIQTPFEKRGTYFETCSVTDASVVTSGSYERFFEKDGTIYHHILDPKTGKPAREEIKSVTVISPSSLAADTLSTAIFASGTDIGRQIIENTEDCRAVILTSDDEVITLE